MSENTVFDAFSEFSEEGVDNVRAVEYISDEGERLDASVARNLEITRSAAARLIEEGAVMFAGKTVLKKSFRTVSGGRI